MLLVEAPPWIARQLVHYHFDVVPHGMILWHRVPHAGQHCFISLQKVSQDPE